MTFFLILIFSFLGLLQGIFVPSDWSVQSGDLPVIVSTGGTAATNLHVVGAFVENRTKDSLPASAFTLCNNQGSCTGVSIPPNSTTTLYLRYDGPWHRPGSYSGKVGIASDGQPINSASLSPLNVYVSSNWNFLGGVALVIFGGLLAWWTKTFATNRITRDQALLPISISHERLTTLEATLKRSQMVLSSKTPNLSGAIADWFSKLDVGDLELKYGLPRKSLFTFTSSTISPNFANFVSEAEKSIALLTVFIKEGIDEVAKLASTGQIPAPAAITSVAAIDSYYSSTLTVEAARKEITQLIPKPAETLNAAPEPSAPPRRAQLMFEIHTLNFAVWLVILLTTALGTIMTVVMKPGFGMVYDYLLCFATSFGIPVVSSLALPSRASVAGAPQATSGSPGLAGL